MRALSPACSGSRADCFPAGDTPAATGCDFAAARTSVSVTRPSGPVPFTLERSTPSSAASRRATGDALTRASSPCRGSRVGCAAGTPASTALSFFRLNFPGLFVWRLHRFFFFLFRRFFTLTANERDLVADVYLAPFFHINFGKRTILRRFPFHGRLVSLDFGDYVASRNLVAFLFLPSDECALRNCVAPIGHL